MKPESALQKLLKKQFPTIVGVVILVIALVAGGLALGQQTFFAPRATPQTTPKKIKITNITDSGFTVSFLTDETTPGFIKYGTDPKDLKSQASDDRDQLTGTVGKYQSHHISVRGLQPATTYNFTLGTGSQASYDNNGQPFSLTTSQRTGAPSAAKTVYGTILNEAGSPAVGSIVYVVLEGVGEMSSLVKDSGSWAIPLSNARTSDGSGYAQITDEMTMAVAVQGPSVNQSSQLQISVGQAQPVETITFGGASTGTKAASTTASSSAALDDQDAATLAKLSSVTETSTASAVGGLSDALNASATGSALVSTGSAEIKVDGAANQVVTTTQPKITGTAAPQTVIEISVHSETQITQTVTSGTDGSYELDIAKLSKNLEPGEHTVTISYTDPATGKVVTKTQTFTVQSTTQLAQANTSSKTSSATSTSSASTPYGSGNPYPVGGATQSASATSSATSTSSGRTTQPATSAALPVSGSVGTTVALLLGGIIFVLAGFWSHWLASQVEEAAENLAQIETE